ncbi:hypothetical protein ACLB2K_029715 [Fragaria x ananassa]
MPPLIPPQNYANTPTSPRSATPLRIPLPYSTLRVTRSTPLSLPSPSILAVHLSLLLSNGEAPPLLPPRLPPTPIHFLFLFTISIASAGFRFAIPVRISSDFTTSLSLRRSGEFHNGAASPPAPPSSESPSPPPEPASDAPVPEPASDVSHSDISADGGMSVGKKAGIGVGVIVGVGLVGLGGFVYKRRQDNIRRSQYGYAAGREML